jgi:hypothetical protein
MSPNTRAHFSASSETPSVPWKRVEMKPIRFGVPMFNVIVFTRGIVASGNSQASDVHSVSEKLFAQEVVRNYFKNAPDRDQANRK